MNLEFIEVAFLVRSDLCFFIAATIYIIGFKSKSPGVFNDKAVTTYNKLLASTAFPNPVKKIRSLIGSKFGKFCPATPHVPNSVYNLFALERIPEELSESTKEMPPFYTWYRSPLAYPSPTASDILRMSDLN